MTAFTDKVAFLKQGDVVVTGHGKAFVAATRLYPDFNRLIEKAIKL